MNVSSMAPLPNSFSKRERAMTDSTTGSFATYFCDHNQLLPQSSSDDDDDDNDESAFVVSDTCSDSQAQDAGWKTNTEAFAALEQLSEGIRIITRQMKHAYDASELQDGGDSGRDRSESSDTLDTIKSGDDDEHSLFNLSRQLEGTTLGADLMGLVRAAQMLAEHARMASHEASVSIKDVRTAQKACRKAENRARKAEDVVRMLFRKHKSLIDEMKKTKTERNALKRQVKALLKENSALKEKANEVYTLELHVANALQAHERMLWEATKQNDNKQKEETGNAATVRLEFSSSFTSSFDERTTGIIEPDYDGQHFAVTESKEAVATSGTIVGGGTGARGSDISTNNPAQGSTPAKALSNTKVGGFGGAIGFSGKWLKNKKSSQTLVAADLSVVTTTLEEGAQVSGPVLISPTYSIVENNNDDNRPGRGDAMRACRKDRPVTPPNTSSLPFGQPPRPITPSPTTSATCRKDRPVTPPNTTSLAFGQPPRPITPSPTTSATVRKGFFHRGSNKERPDTRATTKKPLLQLDDGPTDDFSHECCDTFTSETVLESELNSSAATSLSSSLPKHVCEGNGRPPHSLACGTTAQMSPLSYDFAPDTPTNLLNDKAFRSLAVPVIMDEPLQRQDLDSLAPVMLSPSCPDEIAQIYLDIGKLYEC